MSRLALNQATVKYADLETAVRVTVNAGISAIGTWREPVQAYGVTESARLIRDAGLRVSSHCRAGFFTAPSDTLQQARDDNRRAIDEAAELGAATLVLVAGGLPEGSRDLIGARSQVADELELLVPFAVDVGVQLALEPLHPMYAADRAVISTLRQALDMASQFNASAVVSSLTPSTCGGIRTSKRNCVELALRGGSRRTRSAIGSPRSPPTRCCLAVYPVMGISTSPHSLALS